VRRIEELFCVGDPVFNSYEAKHWARGTMGINRRYFTAMHIRMPMVGSVFQLASGTAGIFWSMPLFPTRSGMPITYVSHFSLIVPIDDEKRLAWAMALSEEDPITPDDGAAICAKINQHNANGRAIRG